MSNLESPFLGSEWDVDRPTVLVGPYSKIVDVYNILVCVQARNRSHWSQLFFMQLINSGQKVDHRFISFNLVRIIFLR